MQISYYTYMHNQLQRQFLRHFNLIKRISIPLEFIEKVLLISNAITFKNHAWTALKLI